MSLLIFVMCCAGLAGQAMSFDLGPMVRIAQCRMQCLREHSIDGTCDWLSSRAERLCTDCWQNCEALETQWESTKSICEGDNFTRCPACQTACEYRKTRLEEEYLPSSLPAPSKGPVKLGYQDMAILLRKVGSTWKESGYYPGLKAPSLLQDTWIIAVLDDGLRHYSWEEWKPTLESLNQGPLVEATLSWTDIDEQLTKQRAIERRRGHNRIRQSYLENYGAKALIERSKYDPASISEDVFRKLFFKGSSNGAVAQPSNFDSVQTEDIFGKVQQESWKEESFVVSWEPETGGLMGNQVVDTMSAQISLLPGTKYLVRIASNDGPGSYPIEVDTRPDSLHSWWLKKKLSENMNESAPNYGPGIYPIEVDTRPDSGQTWWLKKKLNINMNDRVDPLAIIAAVLLFVIMLITFLIVKVIPKRKTIDVNQV